MKESTRKWVEKANRDIEVAKELYNNGYYDYSCYFSQQAVEKLLKAFLVENNRKYPRTHDIKHLINLCVDLDKDFKYLFEIGADKLSLYSTEIRYPEFEYEVTEEDAREAIEIAKKVREFILKKLNIT